jgi:hypothetical protein
MAVTVAGGFSDGLAVLVMVNGLSVLRIILDDIVREIDMAGCELRDRDGRKARLQQQV